MKRTPLRSDPENTREWQRRSQDRLRERGGLKTTKPLESHTAIPSVNRERRKKLREKQFGEKRDWVIREPCEVTGERSNRIHPAHVLKTRGAGGDKLGLVPLRWDVHRSFDEDSDEEFLRKWGRTKESVKRTAALYEDRWQAYRASHPSQESGLAT